MSKNSYEKGRVYEDDIADSFGHRQPQSGAGWTAKQDNRGKDEFKRILFQAKNHTGKQSHTIKREDLKKLERDASMTGRIGVYALRFSDTEEYFMMSRANWEYYFKEPIQNDEGC